MDGENLVDKTRKIHEMGYGLESVDFEARRDFKVRVAGIEASARRGETRKVPYWVGRVLEVNGLGTVTLPDMVIVLKQALSKERIGGQHEFQALEPLFYVKLKTTLKRLEGRDYDRVYDMLFELFRMRNTKIVTKASSMKLSAEMKKRLTVEEQAFYNEIHNTCAEFQKRLTAIDDGPEDMQKEIKNVDVVYEYGSSSTDGNTGASTGHNYDKTGKKEAGSKS